MLTITGKALGQRRPLFEEFSIDPPAMGSGEGGLTLRQLLEATVRHEVQAFENRQQARQFVRVLTETDIAVGLERGKIESGGSEVPLQSICVDEAIGAALQAFEDGIYLVAIDDQQCRDLDSEIFLSEDSRVTFIRLTLLAGG